MGEQEFPEIGDCRDGSILVCHGDDEPEHWISWLESYADQYKYLVEISDKYGSSLCSSYTTNGFLSDVGVVVDSSFWEGSFISGHYIMGWVPVGKDQEVEEKAKALLHETESQLLGEIREALFEELKAIDNLDEFIERVPQDSSEFDHTLRLNLELTSERNRLIESLKDAREKIEQMTSEDTAEIDQACVLLAAALLRKDSCRVVAGPLVLWEDGVVYAFVERGNVPIPNKSAPDVLLRAIQEAGLLWVAVQEKTVFRVYLTKQLRQGDQEISGWKTIWWDEESVERKFIVTPNEQHQKVIEIHEALVAEAAS